MKLIKQQDTQGCGAACLAMLLDISYEEAKKILPSYTSVETMRQTLKELKVKSRCRLLFVGDDKRQHWVLKCNGLYYDPAFDSPTNTLHSRYATVLTALKA